MSDIQRTVIVNFASWCLSLFFFLGSKSLDFPYAKCQIEGSFSCNPHKRTIKTVPLQQDLLKCIHMPIPANWAHLAQKLKLERFFFFPSFFFFFPLPTLPYDYFETSKGCGSQSRQEPGVGQASIPTGSAHSFNCSDTNDIGLLFCHSLSARQRGVSRYTRTSLTLVHNNF